MAKKKKNQRSPSVSSRDSDRSRDNSRQRRDEDEGTRRKDDRAGRREDRDKSRDASKSRSKDSPRFEDRFADVQRQSRIDYSSDEGSRNRKPKRKEESRSKDREERRDSPRRADSRIGTKSRSGKSRSRSRDRLEDNDSLRDARSGTSRKERQSKHNNRSDLSDDDQRDRNGTKKSKHSKGAAGKDSKQTRYDSDASYQGTSRPKSRNDGTAKSKRHEDDFEEVELTPGSRKKESRSEGKLNRGFEKSEAESRSARYDSDASHREAPRSKSRLDDPSRLDSEARRTDRNAGNSPRSKRNEDDFEEVDLTSTSRRDNKRSEGKMNQAYRNSEVELRPAEEPRVPRDQSKRNGVVQPNEHPGELTFRARELNNVPDPRSTLCQRTDIALGVMDTRRNLDQTDAIVFDNPKGRRISTYIAAGISVLEALLGLALGIFLLADAENQKVEDYQTYMVIAYMILHGLALISGILLIWANKKCQLDLMVAWIAVQISTGIVFIAGTILFVVVEMLPENAPVKTLVVSTRFILFSSAFLLFIVLKVLTVACVILRYRRLTFMPATRAPPPPRPVSRWTEYQPPPEEQRAVPATEVSRGPEAADIEPEVPTATESPRAPSTERVTPSKVPPPPPKRTDSIQDGRASNLGSEIRPVTRVSSPPSRTDSIQYGTVASTSSDSTLVSEPPRATIPRITSAASNGTSLKPPAHVDRTPSPMPDVSLARPKTSYVDEQPRYPIPALRAPREERSGLRPESSNTRREPSYPRQEPSYARQDPSLSRQEAQYSRPDPYYRDPGNSHVTREPSYLRDRSPYRGPEPSYGTTNSRPIPAGRPSLATRPGPERPYYDDPESVHAPPNRRYIPVGAVPAIGSPQDWERNGHQYSSGMPRPRQGEAPRGAARRYQDDYEPEPDY